MNAEDVAFAVGLTAFLRERGLPVRAVTPCGGGRFTVQLNGEEPRQLLRLLDALAAVAQLVAYRYHPTSAAVVEVYGVGAEVGGGVVWLR